MVTYDPIGQLQSAFGYTSNHFAIAADTKGYKYDAAQNLNVRTNNGSPATFSVNVKNELTGSFSYDSNGNLTIDTGSRNYLRRGESTRAGQRLQQHFPLRLRL